MNDYYPSTVGSPLGYQCHHNLLELSVFNVVGGFLIKSVILGVVFV